MRNAGLLSGLPLKAALHILDLKQVDLVRFMELCGYSPDQSDLEASWLTIDNWKNAAEYLIKNASGKKDLFFEAGRRSGEFELLGAIEFLPWFLSTPALLIHNIKVILSELDNLLVAHIDYIHFGGCRISFWSNSDEMPPPCYFSFLQGYVLAALELWNCKITGCSGEFENDDTLWVMSFGWEPREFRYRRAMEELLVEPDFFVELFDGLRRFSPSQDKRLNKLIDISEKLRSKAEEKKVTQPVQRSSVSSPNDQYLDLLTPLYDGEIRINRKCEILNANDGALSLLGYSSTDDLCSNYPTLGNLLNRKIDFEDLRKQLRSDRPESRQPFAFEKQDGLMAELLVLLPESMSGSAEENEELSIILRNPSLQPKYSFELGRTRQFLEAIFLNNPAGLQIIDMEGYTIRVNPQLVKMFNLDAHAVVGDGVYNILQDRTLRDIGLSDQLEQALAGDHVILNALRMHNTSKKESPFCNGISHPIIVNVTAYPLKNRSGSVYNVVVSYTDITESYLVQQQLSQIDKLQSIGTLTSGIAHDFNNILGAIVPNADLIIHSAGKSEIIKKKAMAIKTASKRAAALTQQLVSFARETQSDIRTLDMNNCVREAIELIGNAIPKNVSIDFEPDREKLVTRADPLQMQQVLINLIINASDAIPKGGIITIKTHMKQLRSRTTFGGNIIPPGNYVLLSVVDEGIGIPRDVVERVFDPFFTTKEKGRGTGLGLSVVHGIVKSHKGLITISTERNKGTRFDVYLPEA